MSKSKEDLVREIMREAEADGEPLTKAEAEEVAEMEIKSKAVKIRGDSEKTRKTPTRKEDVDKRELINILAEALAPLGASVKNAERELSFNYNGAEYSITLTKHRRK